MSCAPFFVLTKRLGLGFLNEKESPSGLFLKDGKDYILKRRKNVKVSANIS